MSRLPVLISIALLCGSSAAAAGPAATAATTDGQAIAAACGGELYPADVPKMSHEAIIAKLACFTRKAVALNNRNTPRKVDDHTVLERITAQGAQTVYHYRMDHVSRRDLDPAKLASFMDGVRAKVCSTKDMSSIVKLGGSYRYEWIGKDGVMFDPLVVSSC